jgi:hypothetical protein
MSVWYCAELDQLITADDTFGFIFKDDDGKFLNCYNLREHKAFTFYRFDYIGEL